MTKEDADFLKILSVGTGIEIDAQEIKPGKYAVLLINPNVFVEAKSTVALINSVIAFNPDFKIGITTVEEGKIALAIT